VLEVAELSDEELLLENQFVRLQPPMLLPES